MKSKDFAQVLKGFADFATEAHIRQGLDQLGRVFEEAGTTTVAGTLKRVAGTGVDGIPTGPLLPFLSRVRELVGLVGKPAVSKDVNDVVGILTKYPTIYFATPGSKRPPSTSRSGAKVSSALNTRLIDGFNRELEASLGNEAAFADIYSRLQADPEMRAVELRELSRKFARVPAKSKPEALKKIWNRHQSLLTSRAKDRATAGRSAA